MSVKLGFDPAAVPSPCFVVDAALLERNLEVLRATSERSGARILLALKGFAMHRVFPLVRRYLSGAAASSPAEARLAREELGGEVHAYAPAYSDAELVEILRHCDHVSFNSFSQWRRLRPLVAAAAKDVACGMRVNPEHSEGRTAIYDPCAPFSRLGVPRSEFREEEMDGLSGLHVHTLCEQDSDALERTAEVFERRFGDLLPRVRWLNLGGGHHITREGYDIDRLCRVVERFRDRHGLQVYLEPGEAIALGTGYLVATVLDLTRNGIDIAILDTSATAHMPDVLEMPYRPGIIGAGAPGEHPHTYRLGGLTCLAGDVIGDYSFPRPLEVGQRLVFLDMAHYTMVKTTTFNGVGLPSIALCDGRTREVEVVRTFGYEDYKSRLS